MRHLKLLTAASLLVSFNASAQSPSCVSPGKRVALTFDDGPFRGRTSAILDILGGYNARATFFLVGRQVGGQKDMVRRIWADGHELAVHTWSHRDLAKSSATTRQSEIGKGHSAIQNAVPEAVISWWRAPYGSAPHLGAVTAKSYGMQHRLWDVDTLDWKGSPAGVLLHRVVSRVQDGDVVLMHDHGRHTVDMLDPLLSELSNRGFQMVQVSELTSPTCKKNKPIITEEEIVPAPLPQELPPFDPAIHIEPLPEEY